MFDGTPPDFIIAAGQYRGAVAATRQYRRHREEVHRMSSVTHRLMLEGARWLIFDGNTVETEEVKQHNYFHSDEPKNNYLGPTGQAFRHSFTCTFM